MSITEEGNRYVAAPDGFAEIVASQSTKALEIQIRQAIDHLIQGQGGRYESVIYLLEAIVGDQP